MGKGEEPRAPYMEAGYAIFDRRTGLFRTSGRTSEQTRNDLASWVAAGPFNIDDFKVYEVTLREVSVTVQNLGVQVELGE